MQRSKRYNSKVGALQWVGQELAYLAAFYDKGERYHEKYRKNREAFRKLITQRNALAKDLRQFQQAQLERVGDLINWQAFRIGFKDDLLLEESWRREEDLLKRLLLDHLEYAAEIGFMYAGDQIKRRVDASVFDKRMQKLLLKRAEFTAHSMTETVKERIKAKLITDIDLRPKQAAAKRAAGFPLDIGKLVKEAIDEVIDDIFKAKTVADTEIIDGIMDGMLHYAKEADVEYKTWRTQEDDLVDPICDELDGQKVKVDDVFEAFGEEYDLPPDAHMNCRCFVDFED